MKIGVIFPKDSGAIFDISSERTFGGATVQMYTIAQELQSMDAHEVFSFVPEIGRKDVFNKWNFVEIFGKNISLIRGFLRLHRTCKIHNIEVLIQHGLTPFSGALALYCRIFNIKFVFMLAHDGDTSLRCQNHKKAILGNYLFKNANLLISQNKYQQDEISRIWSRKSLVVKLGFAYTNTARESKRSNILWIARCENWKQPEVIIETAKKLSQYSIIMICPKVNDEYFARIQSLASEVSNITFITFAKFVDTWTYFNEASLFINTSLYEGFPQTFVQSVTSGVPIISLNVNPDEFISKSNCGVVCNGDSSVLQQEIVKVMSDKVLWRQMSNNALNYANEFHNIHKNTDTLIKEIKKMV